MFVYIKYIICIGVVSMLLVACSDKPEEKAEILRPVRFQLVDGMNTIRNLKFTGVVKADVKTDFSFKVGGTLVSLNVIAGERIKKGSLIASLDSSDAKLKYDKQLLSMQKAKAQLDNAASNLNRIRELYKNNNVPLGEYETAKEKFTNATGSYETEKRAASLAKSELSYYKLISPVDGIVLVSELSKNENIQAGEVVTIIQTGDSLVVEVGVPEQYITRTKNKQSATIQFPSIPNKSFSGTVTKVAYTANSDTSTYPVVIKILKPDNTIRPGMPANVSFNFATSSKVSWPVVPIHSVAKDSQGNYVFLVLDSKNGLGVVRKKKVKTGRLTNEGFEIIDGLKLGDKVITAGISSLVDGMKVRLLK